MPYNYTRPRAPIAAMYNSPGPCYVLPSLTGYNEHDARSVHVREPQWSLIGKHYSPDSDKSPGPKYYLESGMYRTGRDGIPKYIIAGRVKYDISSETPGPGAHDVPPAIPHVYNSPPSYSLSFRHGSDKTNDNPGPNVYQLDPMMGMTVRSSKKSAPRTFINGRPKDIDSHATPGAAAYGIPSMDVYKEAAPKYSHRFRTKLPGESGSKPGPGAYNDDKIGAIRKRAPEFSFGIQHSRYKAEYISPADNAEE